MKRFMFTLVFAFSLIAVTAAQNRPSVQERVERMKARLSLTDQQAAQVDSILTAAEDSAKTITTYGADRRAAMRQIMTKAHSDIEKILTDTQKAEFEKILSQPRGRMRNRPDRNN